MKQLFSHQNKKIYSKIYKKMVCLFLLIAQLSSIPTVYQVSAQETTPTSVPTSSQSTLSPTPTSLEIQNTPSQLSITPSPLPAQARQPDGQAGLPTQGPPSPIPSTIPPVGEPSPPPLASPSPQISPSFLSPSAMPSALMRQKMAILPLEKKTYQARETVRIKVINIYDERTTISIRNKNGEELPVVVDKETIGEETHLKLFPPANFKPGRYRLTIIDSSGNSFEQNFDWGVLAINTNKSIYLPSDQAKIAMAVLDEGGAPVCGAYVKLEISTPSGNTTTLGTWDRAIRQSPKCGIREVTYVPDYETEYSIGNELGVYNMKLTAETKNGIYSIQDFFEVRKDVLFDVERVSATRIFPLHEYSSGFNITSNIDFEGTIVETVPENFAVKPFNDGRVITYDRVATVSASIGKGMVLGAQTAGRLLLPFSGSFPITLRYGEDPDDARLSAKYRRFGLNSHDAVDFAMSEGTPLLAVDDGEVLLAGDGLYGITIIVKHAWGKSYYGHLSQPSVDIGQKVSKGEIIGLSGNTGLSTGPHLHFAILPKNPDFDNGYFGKVDPLAYLNLNTQGQPAQVAGTSTSIFNVKEIVWDLKIKKGEKVTLGYLFDAPDLSPQFYLLGPLKFFSSLPLPLATVSPTPTLTTPIATNSSSLINNQQSTITPSPIQPVPIVSEPAGDQTSTTSATFLNNQPSQQLPIISSSPPTSGNLIFQEARRWQIAADADVLINALADAYDHQHKTEGRMVFLNDQVGYYFYQTQNNNCGYSKTTNGGTSWSAYTNLYTGLTCQLMTSWYDQWTRGDTTGRYIHLVTGTTDSNGDIYYRFFDTTNDSVSSNTLIFNGTTGVGFDPADELAITKATNDTLYALFLDASSGGTSNTIRSCSTDCTNAANWSNVGTAPMDSVFDVLTLTYLSNGSVMIIRDDVSANKLDYSIWNGTSWDTTWPDIGNMVENVNSPNAYSFSTRRYDGNMYLAWIDSAYVNDTSEIRSAVWNGSSWADTTDVVANTVTNSSESYYDLSLAVDEESSNVYVAYNRGNGYSNNNLYYKTSNDSMSTWSNESSALNSNNANSANIYLNLNYLDSDRIYFAYFTNQASGNDTLYGGTISDLKPPLLIELLKHGDWWSRAGKRREFTF